MTDLDNIPLDVLDAHPDNPRLQFREDVVERLVLEIGRSGFGPEHALLVRPMADRFQIAAGHHRAEAARRVGLDAVPCWVREMDDDEAFMQLVLSNAQGELLPLEIGMHALRAVPLSSGGRGRKGGISEYAERIGWTKQYVGQLRDAAEVLQTVNLSLRFELAGRAKHLYEISKSPRAAWPPLVDRLVTEGDQRWTVELTTFVVKQLRDLIAVTKELPSGWFPVDKLTARVVTDDRFKPSTVDALVRTRSAVVDWLAENATDDQYERHTGLFEEWLIANAGGDSWDRRKISQYHADLVERLTEESRTPEIRCGDFRDVLDDGPDKLADNSVDLILTDPPYGDDAVPSYGHLAKFAARVLKPGGSLICYTGQSILPQVFGELGVHLRYWWTLSLDHSHGGQQLPGKWVIVEWKPIVWFVKDHRAGNVYLADKIRGSKPDKGAHEWAQGIDEVFYLIDQLTDPGALVVDPFAGSGAFGRAALERGRRFIGADLNPESAVGSVTT